MRRSVLAIVLLGTVAPAAVAQPTIRVTGRVVADDTGDPLPNARVVVTSPAASAPVLTDREGLFTFSGSWSSVTVAAGKTGFIRGEIRSAADQPIEIRLVRSAAISGRMLDARGDPLAGAHVTAETLPSARATFTTAAAADTDDRGEYRLGGLEAGTFIVTARAGKTTFYPGVDSRDQAQRFSLQPGEERSSIDFDVRPNISANPSAMMPPPPPTPVRPAAAGVIRGHVSSTDGSAVADVEVLLVSLERLQPVGGTRSDDEGRFEFLGVSAGSYRIAPRKIGYSLPGNGTSRGPAWLTAGVAVDLTDGQVRERVDVTLARWSAIEGRVVDEFGGPVQGAGIQLLQVKYQDGGQRLVAVAATARLTDDLGRYRIFGLAPGRYIVSAAVGDVAGADLPGYVRSYYPGTPTAGEAQFLTLELSQEASGIDFPLARGRTATISGTLLNAAGQPSTSGSVRLIPSRRSTSSPSLSTGARLTGNGQFQFPNVAPGEYVIQVDRIRQSRSTEGEFGTLPVSVEGADVTDLVLQTSTGSSITGRVTFEAVRDTPMPRPAQVEISPVPVDPDLSPPSIASAYISTGWSFEIHGIHGPRRLELKDAPAGWALKDIRVGGIDVTDRPLTFGTTDQSLADVEVVLTDRVNTVSGLVSDDHGRPVPAARLVVFSTDRDRWYPHSRYFSAAPTNAGGAAVLAGLPAGSYYAAAVAKLPPDGNDAWQDPAFLESLVAHATAFTLGEGQKQALTFKLTDR